MCLSFARQYHSCVAFSFSRICSRENTRREQRRKVWRGKERATNARVREEMMRGNETRGKGKGTTEWTKKSERYYARSGVIRNERESPALRDATVNQVAPAIVRNNWSIDVDLATIVPRAYCRWCCYIVLVSQARRKQNTAKTIFKVRGTLQWLQEKDRLPPLPPPPVCSCSGSDRADTDPTRRRRSKEERKEE